MIRPDNIKKVVLDGHDFTLEEFVGIARYNAKVSLGKKVIEKINKSRDYVEKIIDKNEVTYGITTGFGELAKVAVDIEKSDELSTNLVLSHCVATGQPYNQEQVRGMMILLCNNLSHGYSGCRLEVVEILVDMLNRNVIPLVPQKGSLGASGDLAPLSHVGLVLLGRGKAYYEGKLYDGKKAMAKAGIKTVDCLVNKEGLALTNGTHAMTSLAALNVYDAMRLEKLCDVSAAMSFSSLCGQLNAYDEKIHKLRRQIGQLKVAQNMKLLTKGSTLIKKAQGQRVQDAYCLRCIPQVHGACRDAIEYVKEIVEKELNAVTDNPLIFVENDEVLSGGNFHGEPIALAMDFLGVAVSEIASISERRIERMVNGTLSNGLTPFLTVDAGVNSGYMIVQYSAASMVSENKVLAHPASVDSIPSSGNQEDFVSMGTTAARKCSWIIQNTLSVIAFELLSACQAVDIRSNDKGAGLSEVLRNVYQFIRKDISFMNSDRELRIDIEKIEEIIRDDELFNLILDKCPKLQ